MDAFIHRSQDRGHVNIGWLESKHSFSFGSWYNPKYMGVSALRVINDDVIAGHQGFGQHPHDNMEILTCVLKAPSPIKTAWVTTAVFRQVNGN